MAKLMTNLNTLATSNDWIYWLPRSCLSDEGRLVSRLTSLSRIDCSYRYASQYEIVLIVRIIRLTCFIFLLKITLVFSLFIL